MCGGSGRQTASMAHMRVTSAQGSPAPEFESFLAFRPPQLLLSGAEASSPFRALLKWQICGQNKELMLFKHQVGVTSCMVGTGQSAFMDGAAITET